MGSSKYFSIIRVQKIYRANRSVVVLPEKIVVNNFSKVALESSKIRCIPVIPKNNASAQSTVF